MVDILRPVVDNPRSDGDGGEQLTQRLMLVEALLKIEDYKVDGNVLIYKDKFRGQNCQMPMPQE